LPVGVPRAPVVVDAVAPVVLLRASSMNADVAVPPLAVRSVSRVDDPHAAALAARSVSDKKAQRRAP
jgi:hypothetical protein